MVPIQTFATSYAEALQVGDIGIYRHFITGSAELRDDEAGNRLRDLLALTMTHERWWDRITLGSYSNEL